MKPSSRHALVDLLDALIKTRGPNCDLNDVDVSAILDFRSVFAMGPRLQFNGDISRWDVAQAITLDGMFKHSHFNGDISQWNTTSAATMEGMFAASRFNGDVSRWDTSSVKDMGSMFESTSFTGDLSNWNVRRVKTMRGMFCDAAFDGDIGQWDVAACLDFRYMFQGSQFGQDISNWRIDDTAHLSSMFSDDQRVDVPNMYHWYSLASHKGAPALPTQWQEHAANAKAVGQAMGVNPMDRNAMAHWMAQTWRERNTLDNVAFSQDFNNTDPAY